MQAHATRTGTPLRARFMLSERRDFLPALPGIGGMKKRCVFHAGENDIGIG
jgi:hypothetical protein